MRCLLVDNNSVDAEKIKEFIQKTPFLELVGSVNNAFDAIEFLTHHTIDLIFTEIDLPDLSGIEMLKSLPTMPMVVFVTSNKKFALEAFTLDAINYLIKPVDYPVFLKSCQKALKLFKFSKNQTTDLQNDFLFLKVNKELVRVAIKDILYIEGLKDYIIVKTTNNNYVTYLSLSKILTSLRGGMFVQIHRSYIINVKHIQKIIGNQVLISNKIIPIGRVFKQKAMKKIINRKLVKK